MKKLYHLLVALLFYSYLSAADNTASIQLKVTSMTDSKTDVINLLENEDYSEDFVEGEDSRKMSISDQSKVYIYTMVGTEMCAVKGTNNLDSTEIIVKTNSSTKYKFSVPYKDGIKKYFLLDKDSAKLTSIKSTSTYECEMPAGQSVTGRFYIIYKDSCDTATSENTFTICENQLPYEYKGDLPESKTFVINNDTTILDTIVGGAASECDSIATVHFLIHRVVDTISTDTTICEGSSIEWHGQLISEEGIYYDTAHYVTTLCDSVFYSINVSVHRLMTPVHTDTTICDGSSIEWHGQLISEEGIYYDTVHYATTKCDSAFYTLNVAIHRVMDTISSDTTICEGSSFMWRGQTCDTDSTYRDTIRYIETGCDSAYYSMKVTVHKVIEVLDKDSAICEGSSFIWRDKFLCDADSTYRDTVRYMETGCDSAYYSMKVTVMKVIEVLDEDSTICEGSSFVWRGQTCDADSTYRDTIRYIETGCDSAYYSMKVTVHKVEEIINKDTTICERSSFEWHGQIISEEGIYHDTARYVATGCDSIIYSLQVAIIPTQRATIYDTLCLKDAQIKYPYLEIEGSGTYYDTIPAQTTKCDSITTYQIQILDKDIVDSLPAVSKYNNWLLMINYNKITELGYAVAEKEVMWYQVVGEIDPASEITDDKKVGEGFYYTADKSLSSSYYAIMIDRNSICGTLMRTIVLDCSAQKSKGPRRVYTVDGQLVQTITDENVDLEQVKATKGAGLYMLRSEDGEQSETIKFIITQ